MIIVDTGVWVALANKNDTHHAALWDAEKKPGFWGYPWGYRNRVSVVNIRSYLWDAEKKPGFWGFWG